MPPPPPFAPPGLPRRINRGNQSAWTNSWEKLICGLDCDCHDDKEINNIENGLEKVTITVDSGAADTVGPKSIAQGIPIKPTKASQLGENYRAANGTTIKNYGQKRLEGVDANGINTGITIQVADVRKTLASVGKMTEAGNIIIFSKVGV